MKTLMQNLSLRSPLSTNSSLYLTKFGNSADAVENDDDLFKLFQSDLDEFRSIQVLDPTLVPDGTTADDFADSNQTLSVARFCSNWQ